ncbi:hypothetical protein BX667DRAFT_436886 [Coemansia mojavensis]|nr:hypothetical protein BX667DRAFT_436886 [Coemansia mojavensis]
MPSRFESQLARPRCWLWMLQVFTKCRQQEPNAKRKSACYVIGTACTECSERGFFLQASQARIRVRVRNRALLENAISSLLATTAGSAQCSGGSKDCAVLHRKWSMCQVRPLSAAQSYLSLSRRGCACPLCKPVDSLPPKNLYLAGGRRGGVYGLPLFWSRSAPAAPYSAHACVRSVAPSLWHEQWASFGKERQEGAALARWSAPICSGGVQAASPSTRICKPDLIYACLPTRQGELCFKRNKTAAHSDKPLNISSYSAAW